jgi:hypothetical protein
MKNESSQDSYISIKFYFVENIQSQMKQTPIKYLKGGNSCASEGDQSVPYILDICR